jgi:hypothetical protein
MALRTGYVRPFAALPCSSRYVKRAPIAVTPRWREAQANRPIVVGRRNWPAVVSGYWRSSAGECSGARSTSTVYPNLAPFTRLYWLRRIAARKYLVAEIQSEEIVDDVSHNTREPLPALSGSSASKFTTWDAAYTLNLAIASFITYWGITHLLSWFVDQGSDFLGGMWAVVAVVFVYRDTREQALRAGMERLIATCVSFALCQLYLLIFPFTAFGMAALLGLGALVMAALGRRADIVTTGITTTVVMVVAGMNPETAWQQPMLRLVDTVFGIAVGVICSLWPSVSSAAPPREPRKLAQRTRTSNSDADRKGEIT